MQEFAFHLMGERENRKGKQQVNMKVNGKASFDTHSGATKKIPACKTLNTPGIPGQAYLSRQENLGEQERTLLRGAARNMLPGRCLGHPLDPQWP